MNNDPKFYPVLSYCENCGGQLEARWDNSRRTFHVQGARPVMVRHAETHKYECPPMRLVANYYSIWSINKALAEATLTPDPMEESDNE